MPLRTYKCNKCDGEFEELILGKQSEQHSNQEPIPCKLCDGEGLAYPVIGAPYIDKYKLQRFMHNARGNGAG
jgi:DNA-directed RNA polymerase subunit RPC12/RpoP